MLISFAKAFESLALIFLVVPKISRMTKLKSQPKLRQAFNAPITNLGQGLQSRQLASWPETLESALDTQHAPRKISGLLVITEIKLVTFCQATPASLLRSVKRLRLPSSSAISCSNTANSSFHSSADRKDISASIVDLLWYANSVTTAVHAGNWSLLD